MKKRLLYLTIALFVVFSTSAFAATVTIDSIDNPLGFFTDYTRGIDPRPRAALTGEFLISAAGFESAAFCVELGISAQSGTGQQITTGSYTGFDGAPSAGVFNGTHASWLMDQYSTGLGFDETTKGVSKQVANTALQLAIWDTLYDFENGSTPFSRDYFTDTEYYNDPIFQPLGDGTNIGDATPDGDLEEDAWALAEEYKTALITASSDGLDASDFSGNYRFSIITFENAQNLLVAQAIPEPGTMILFGFGLLGIGAIGRRKN